jgi:hypothetical protein
MKHALQLSKIIINQEDYTNVYLLHIFGVDIKVTGTSLTKFLILMELSIRKMKKKKIPLKNGGIIYCFVSICSFIY